MSNFKTTAKLMAVAAMLSGLAGPAAAFDASIQIFGRVPTICRVEIGGGFNPALTAGEHSLGQMTELCNNVDGYRLVLNHPAGLEGAWFVVDGQRVPLSGSTHTVVVDSMQPAYRESGIAIVLSEDVSNLQLSMSAEPKGMVF